MELTLEEEKIRTRWLLLNIFLLLIFPFLFYFFEWVNYSGSIKGIIIYLYRYFWYVAAFYILNHCAYRKRGILLLTLVISIDLFLVYFIFQFMLIAHNLYNFIASSAGLAFLLVHTYYSFQLRRLNKKGACTIKQNVC
ncbi:hypothetical protein PHSC3_000076 [Chlamydiales bacterium STE3]|nr:hypothetical protein PHSC3_000076 [Chlamydiales bacterium STE3]